MSNLLRTGAILLCWGLAKYAACGVETTPFMELDLAGYLTQDTNLKEFFGPVPPGTKVKFSPGGQIAVNMGAQITDWLAPSAEIGLMVNSITSITGASHVGAALLNVPVLVNLRVQWPHRSRWAPFAGAGVGYTLSTLSTSRVTLGDTSIKGSDSDAVFTYQASAGLRYGDKDVGVSLTYRCLIFDNASWSFGSSSEKIRFGSALNQIFTIALDVSF